MQTLLNILAGVALLVWGTHKQSWLRLLNIEHHEVMGRDRRVSGARL